MVNCGYHPIKHRPLDSAWMVDSGYHLLSIVLLIVLGWWTVDIILLSIVLLG